MDEFLTVAEVAELLKLNQMTIRNWIDRGTLPTVRVGPRRVRIRRADLDELLERGATRPRKPAEGVWDGEVPPPMNPADPSADLLDDDRR